MFLEDFKHKKSDKLYIAEIINFDSEGNEFKYLDIKNSSFYLDDVIKSVLNSDYFWSYIYIFEDLGSEGKLDYVYTIDDDGNIYNDTDRWKSIFKDVNGRNVESDEELDEFINNFITEKD